MMISPTLREWELLKFIYSKIGRNHQGIDRNGLQEANFASEGHIPVLSSSGRLFLDGFVDSVDQVAQIGAAVDVVLHSIRAVVHHPSEIVVHVDPIDNDFIGSSEKDIRQLLSVEYSRSMRSTFEI